eukprot:jgi/Tetstr1/438450/TSEL_027006.t1
MAAGESPVKAAWGRTLSAGEDAADNATSLAAWDPDGDSSRQPPACTAEQASDVEAALYQGGSISRLLPANVRHVMWNALTTTQQKGQLDGILRPLCYMCLFQGMGGVLASREGRAMDNDNEHSKGRRRQRSSLRSVGAAAPWMMLVLMCIFNAKGVALLGTIGRGNFPWVLALCYLLWWTMNALKAARWLYCGGFETMVHGVLKELHTNDLYLTTDAHFKDLARFLKWTMWVGVAITWINTALLPIFLFVKSAGASESTRQIMCYPIESEGSACTAVSVIAMVLAVTFSGYWVLSTVSFMVVCHTFRRAFQALAQELPSRLHWARTSPSATDPKGVVATAMLRHQSLNDHVAKAAKLWNVWITAALCLYIPLVVFILYQMLNMLSGDSKFGAMYFATCVVWTINGVSHLSAIALSASSVMVAAHNIAHMMLAPRMQGLLGNDSGIQTMVLVFNKYVDEEPTCFRILHLKLTQEMVGSLFSLRRWLHDSGPARRGVAPAAAWTVADALSVAGVAAGAAWAPRIDAAARSLQPARVRHHPADVLAFTEVAAAWLAKARAVLAERHRRRGARRAGGAGQSSRAPSRGGRRRLQALAWRFRAFAERRMTELVRSWDDARTEAFYAGHARQRRTDADLFAALLVGTADTVVALVEDGELSRAAGRLSSKGMGDLSDPAILAQLRDKHPPRTHPIPDAAYDIPVDEAALTVDMRVPYQQLKQHVAAGPSGMRNEYLRCLVGEYAPASGPAAVRAMSEVASMYLQGRLPGWFNRLFASARLVAPVKKLGEGRAPDVRPVAVGEAERRAAERAVVDNMKEAYVSVLAPSQLGVGIPAGDSVLIHGVRLIAEKLGPPSLSTDSYLVVDDRSAPLRSEDGVQQGAPLATTSFCVAIHPEVQQCDTTLEVNDGAARFNADDGILVGLPEHVWPALHAFRTSIKASVGLEVRFDKIQAYSADMEAARREAPADIEWPELDGHHGIAVLNVPLGSPEYVQAYMRGKAEELREEVDASLSKLLSAKPSRRYTHALHHHAWALLKHCMQHKAGYWLRNCLPSEVEAFAEAVDATILAAVERVLGVSFDPSTYGTDTNPVVTDFLAELLHDPDPMAAEVATLSEDAVARARSRLHLPTRLKGAGIRRMATVRDAAFIGCMNAILPRFLTRNSGTNTPTPGFFDPQLGSVLGRGSFNANSSARQYDHFLNDAHGSDSYAAEMREAWGRLQAATAGHLGDADARQMEREVEAASGSQKELTAFLDQANNSRLRNEVCALPATCRERILFNQLDAASGMWTVAIPTARTAMTPHELREVAAGYFFLPSPCLAPVVGCQIILPSTEHNPVIVDLYGDALMNLPAP